MFISRQAIMRDGLIAVSASTDCILVKPKLPNYRRKDIERIININRH